MRAGSYDGLLTITRAADEELVFEYLSASPTSQTRVLVDTRRRHAIAIADRLESRRGRAR